MPNEQLLAYIRSEVARGMDRNVLIRELLSKGWQVTDINAAFGAVDSPSGAPSVSASVVPPAQSFQGTNQTPSTQPTIPSEFPGVFSLINDGMSIYRARLGAFLGLGGLVILWQVIFTLVWIGFLFGGLALFVSSKSLLLIPVGIVAFIGIIVGAMWINTWFGLGIAHAVRGQAEAIGIRESLRRARPQVWSAYWLMLITAGVYIGYLLIAVFLPSIALFSLFWFVGAASSVVAIIIIGVFAIIAFITVTLVAFTRFSLSVWSLVDGEARGVRALLTSWKRVRSYSKVLMWRLFWIGILFFVSYLVIVLASTLVSSLIPSALIAGILKSTLQLGALYLLLIPVESGTLFSIYAYIKNRETDLLPESSRSEYVGLLSLGILGLIFAIAIPVGASFILASLNTTKNNGSDAVRQADISTIQTQLEIYYGANKNAYPTTLDALVTANNTGISLPASAITDPVTRQLFSYSSDGQSYNLCATLSTGKNYCVQYPSTGSASSTPVTTSATSSALVLSATSYVDATNGYRITPPEGWQAKSDFYKTSNVQKESFISPIPDTVVATGGKMMNYPASVAVMVTAPVATTDAKGELAAYMQGKIASLEKGLSAFKLLNNTSSNVGAAPASLILGTWEDANGVKIEMLEVDTVKNGRVYEIVFLAAAEKWATYEELFKKVITSFSFTS